MTQLHDPIVEHVELFSGAADPALARVYASVRLAEQHRRNIAHLKLRGFLIGPECEFAQTLPARIPLADLGSGETLLAEAVVPDPCFWTPELPFQYRVELEVIDHGAIILHHTAVVGIHRHGVRSRELFFDAKRFVLRGSFRHYSEGVPENTESDFARETATAAVVSWPSDALCQLASHKGILLVADMRATLANVTSHHVAERVRAIAQWPAVIMAIFDDKSLPLIELSGSVRNLLLGQYISLSDSPAVVGEQAQVVFAEVGQPDEFATQFKNCDRPVIAVRRLPEPVKIEQARAACDALQRDLAPHGDFAGYIV
jgi:hypothetical protein